MFGYVTIRKDDLKVKDYNKYQAYYCGLCQDIKEAYGKKGQAMYCAVPTLQITSFHRHSH